MRWISAAQERGAEAYSYTPHEPSEEHAEEAGQARWRAIRAPLATPLFLGRMFFLRPSDHRRLVDGWAELFASSERRVPESLVIALAHPLLLEQLEARRPHSRREGPSLHSIRPTTSPRRRPSVSNRTRRTEVPGMF